MTESKCRLFLAAQLFLGDFFFFPRWVFTLPGDRRDWQKKIKKNIIKSLLHAGILKRCPGCLRCQCSGHRHKLPPPLTAEQEFAPGCSLLVSFGTAGNKNWVCVSTCSLRWLSSTVLFFHLFWSSSRHPSNKLDHNSGLFFPPSHLFHIFDFFFLLFFFFLKCPKVSNNNDSKKTTIKMPKALHVM